MFSVTDKAVEMIKQLFTGRDEKPCVRVYLNAGG